MIKRNVMIKLLSYRTEMSGSLFEGDEEEYEELPEENGDDESNEPTEMLIEGRLLEGTDRIELVYEESELSGMEGSVTSVGFDRSNPGLISMMRSGTVSTALVFEENRRHICVYHTPFSDFEVCSFALRVENRLLSEGRIELDYIIEIHGAQAERCRMILSIHEIPKF